MTATNGNGSLSTRAMLVSLEINMWTARRLDKKITNEVAKDYGVGAAVGRYNKCLLIEDINGTPAKEFKAVESAGNAARNEHYTQSLPWGQEGSRIVTAANFIEWANAMREAKDVFLKARQDFIDAYPRLVEQSRRYLTQMEATTGKTMFNESNYPTQARIERKFRFATGVLPLPDAGDFRVQLSSPQVAAIKAQIEGTINATVETATQDLFERLNDLARRVAHLGDPKSVIQKALAQDIKSVCAIAGRLNLTGNTYLDAFRERIVKELSFAPDMLKAVPEEREALAARASQIQSDMAAFMRPVE